MYKKQKLCLKVFNQSFYWQNSITFVHLDSFTRTFGVILIGISGAGDHHAAFVVIVQKLYCTIINQILNPTNFIMRFSTFRAAYFERMKTNIYTKGLSMPKSFLMPKKNWRKNKPFNAKTNLLTQKLTCLHKNTCPTKAVSFTQKTFLQKLLTQKLTSNFATKNVSFYFLLRNEPAKRKSWPFYIKKILFTQNRTCSTQRGSSDARPLGWRGATQRSEHSTVPSSLHSQADSEIFNQKKINYFCF